MRLSQGIRTVAVLEASKGIGVLLTGLGLFALVHQYVQRFAESLVRHAHLNPAAHTPRVFLEFAGKLDDARLMQLALAATMFDDGASPKRDVTFVFYDHEEVEAVKSGLGRLVRNHGHLLHGDFPARTTAAWAGRASPVAASASATAYADQWRRAAITRLP